MRAASFLLLTLGAAGCHWLIGHAPPGADRGPVEGIADRPAAADGARDRAAPADGKLDAPSLDGSRSPDQRPSDLKPPDKRPLDQKPADQKPPDQTLPPDKSTGQPELCGNGLDDDGDKAIDCADLDCQQQGWRCEPSKAVDLRKRAFTASGASCGGLKTYYYQKDLSWTCSCGTCVSPPGGCCDLAPLTCGANSCGEKLFNAPLSCSPLTPPPTYCGTPEAKPRAGCGCSSAVLTISDGWSSVVDSCPVSVAGGGCSSGMICAPPPQPGFTRCEPGTVCTQSQITVYAGQNDTRVCGCGCTTPTCTAGGYAIYCGNTTCSAASTLVPPGTPCKPLSCGATTGIWATSVEPTTSCVNINSGATGTVSGTLPASFCCPGPL